MSDEELSFIVFNPSEDLREMIRVAEATGAVICVAGATGLEYKIRVERYDSQSGASENIDGADASSDIWRNYDPDRVLAALDASAGAFADMDVEQVLDELRAQRSQADREWLR
jgi:hypothetical protein